MSSTTPLDRIGVGIDTARYGHRVAFLRPDRQPAAKPMTVLESRAGYQALHDRLTQLHQQHPQAHFHVRIDAAGQYAANLEHFLRSLPWPLTLSIGEPKRNKDYQKAHFPKRTTDDTESQAMARFAVVELPKATAPISPALMMLREVAGRLQAKVKQSTQAINRLHNLLARVFPELANLTDDLSTSWVLHLLDKYPTAQRIGQARLTTLQQIPYLAPELAEQLHLVAQQSVACLSGDVAETLVRELVAQVRHTQRAEDQMRRLLSDAYTALPASAHLQVVTIPGIGVATAAVLIAQTGDINRFATPQQFVGYFGVFPEENTSGVDKYGTPVPPGTLRMSPKGNDLVRSYLWNAARSAIIHNPAIGALYRRLKAKGKRGDVALGQCMRKLLHLVYAVWKTDRPFDDQHVAWETPRAAAQTGAGTAAPATGHDQTPPRRVTGDGASSSNDPSERPARPSAAAPSSNEAAVGHKRDEPAEEVVTTANATTAPIQPAVKPVPLANRAARPRIDFAFLRQQVTMEQVLQHLGLLHTLRGRGLQRRGPCPIHGQPDNPQPTFSAHLGKHIFQCFHADCRAQGNVLDLWAAVHRLPLYEAALHLAETFHLPRNREEEPVGGTR
ncbi:MAG TPA: IS110 family transposase [Gemmataceae bacterium]|jgi:transposase|nr:IS110 family transposase [Gemmataceae bacterium]